MTQRCPLKGCLGWALVLRQVRSDGRGVRALPDELRAQDLRPRPGDRRAQGKRQRRCGHWQPKRPRSPRPARRGATDPESRTIRTVGRACVRYGVYLTVLLVSDVYIPFCHFDVSVSHGAARARLLSVGVGRPGSLRRLIVICPNARQREAQPHRLPLADGFDDISSA